MLCVAIIIAYSAILDIRKFHRSRVYHGLADWNTPEGGFYIWLTFKDNIPIERLFEKAAKAVILLNPGDMYDFEHNNSLRLSYAYTSCEEFETAAKKLADIVKII